MYLLFIVEIILEYSPLNKHLFITFNLQIGIYALLQVLLHYKNQMKTRINNNKKRKRFYSEGNISLLRSFLLELKYISSC